MPLSEGATRARHARRLLQKVLDFVPDGYDDPPDRPDRAARRRRDRRGGRGAGGRPHHLRLGRQDPHRAQRPSGGPPSSRRRSTRSSASRRATSPSSSSAVRATSSGCSSRSAAVRTRSSRSGSPTPSPRTTAPTLVVLHLVPPGITIAVRAQAERALAAFIKQHARGPRRGRSCARPRTSATRSCAKPTRPTSS